MNGAVIPNTPIAVDFWRLRQCPHSRVFFLSHMHADHTAGLTSSWKTYPIYCSEVTRRLVIAKLGINSELVVGLPLNESMIIKLDETGKETMTVTLVDANHCPGSVMFIFEGYFGRILYTGDFRYCDSAVTHSAIQGKQFDVLYLDNTYCDPKCVFPSRTQASVNILEIIRSHPDCKVVIGLHNLGKESLLHTISVVFKMWIGVDSVRMETLKLLQMPNVFTCEVDKVRIRVVKSFEISKKNIQLWNSEEPTIAILPTCLFVGSTNPYANVENVFVVPYSDHSSFEELRKFVENVKPGKIIPIVHKHRLSPGETVNNRVNMNVFQDLMDPSPLPQFTVPLSVQCFMTAEVRQVTKKKVRATGKLPARKPAKVKKPCGVVFPPSQEATDMKEDKGDLGISFINELDGKLTAVKGSDLKEQSKKQDIAEEREKNVCSLPCQEVTEMERNKGDTEIAFINELDEKLTAVKGSDRKEQSKKKDLTVEGERNVGTLLCQEATGMKQDKYDAETSELDTLPPVVSDSDCKEQSKKQDVAEGERNAELIRCKFILGHSGGKLTLDKDSNKTDHVAQTMSEDEGNSDSHIDSSSLKSGLAVSSLTVEYDTELTESGGNSDSDIDSSSSKSGLVVGESVAEIHVVDVLGDNSFQDDSLLQAITEDETVVAALFVKSGSAYSQSAKKLKVHKHKDDKKFQDEILLQANLEDVTDEVAALSVKSGLAVSESGKKLKVHNHKDVKNVKDECLLQAIVEEETDVVAALSVKSGSADSESGKKLKVPNHEGDRKLSWVLRSKANKKDVVDLSLRAKDTSRNTNRPVRENSEGKASAASSPHMKTKDVSSNNDIVPAKNLSIKRKYREISEDNDNNAHKNSLRKKKFNIYTGQSCDFARKVLEEMVGNGAFRE